jgi:hypothetical protein
MPEDTDIQKLLRLKRYENPPEGYFDDFLLEFQRRQRTELLRVPLREILWDRVTSWFDSVRVPTMAYATILVLGVGATAAILTGLDGDVSNANAVAVVNESPVLPQITAGSQNPSLPPSYVLETRPVSYESPFSF